jgi:dipeptidyl-peptidase-4
MMHARFTRLLSAVLCALLLLAPDAAQAQQDDAPPFTLRAIHASNTYQPASFQGGRWAEEGPVIRYIESVDDSDATHLMSYNLETDERSRLIDGTNLYAEDVDRLVPIEGYQYSADESTVLIYTDSERVWRYNTKGYYYIYDLEAQTLTPIAAREDGFQMFAKFNPAGDKVAFVRNRNLFVVDLETGTETALTTDGSEGAIINGTFDWVYEEEFGLRDGFQWSPGGQYIAFYKLDESDTREFAMTDFRTRYPTYERFRYPKAGEVNSEIQIGVIDMDRVDTTQNGQPHAIQYFDTQTWDPQLDQAAEATDPHEYLAHMGWTPGSDGETRVWMFRLNRNQNQLDLLYGNPSTGGVTTVLEEEEETYIDVEGRKIKYLDDGEHFVWMTENPGYKHLHLYRNDGTLVGPITQGDWEVTGFHGIDEETNTAYFTSTEASSIERHLYRTDVSFEPHDAAAVPTRITTTAGTHDINLSKDRRYYIDTHSTITQPPVTTLHRTDGTPLTVLERNDDLIQKLAQLDLPEPAFMQVPAADGTPLNAYVIRPSDFDPGQQYPLLMYVYGGPGAQTVMNEWGGTRQLWHTYLAEEHGLIVASVDNRGTGGRGKAFQDVPYRQLGQPEARDQIAAARHFGAESHVDSTQIGIWGWSYGGYMTLLSMLYQNGPDTFAAGVSVAPVTDWRFYDTIYTERYMAPPQQNEDGYTRGSPLNYADRLQADQNLLLVHGDFDDNVHYQNSAQMADQLQAANKQFEFMVYPGRNHGIYGGLTRLHLFTMVTDFIGEHLVGYEQELSAVEQP